MQAHLLIAALLASSPAAVGRQSGVAVEEAKLLGSDTDAADALGAAVAISGDTALFGAPKAEVNERGVAYVFVRSGGAWSQQAKLTAPPGTFGDFDHFGNALDIDGDVAVVGAPDWGNEDGRAYVFQRSAGAWTIQHVLGPPTTGYFYAFGSAVALLGDTLAISAPKYGPTLEGTVSIYKRIGGAWSFQSWISNPAFDVADAWMGEQLDLSDLGGSTLLLARTRNSGYIGLDGGVLGFTETAGVWTQRFGIWGFGGTIDALRASGSLLVLGVPAFATNGLAGSGRVFTFTVTPGPPAGLTQHPPLSAPDPDVGDRFGAHLALDGNWLIVGAPGESDPGAAARGAAYVFERVNNVWISRSKLVASDAAGADHFGDSVAGSSAGMLVGAPDDSNSAGAGAGSVYAFRVGAVTATYCTAAPSGGGCVAAISSVGSPSASFATPFSIHVAGVDGQRTGLVFYGVSSATSAPWNGVSYLCVEQPVQRTPPQSSGGAAQACNGSFSLDWNSFQLQHPTSLGSPFSAGDECFAQAWFREPASPKSTHLSDALAFELQP